MLSEAALVALVRRYQSRLGFLADTAAFAMASAWDRLGSYDEPDVARYTDSTARAATAAREASVRLSAGFYTALGSSPPVPVDPAAIPVEPATRDPFIAYWQALKSGELWADAILVGHGRAEAVGTNLVVRSARLTGDVTIAATGQQVVGWRRVLRGTSCAWCATVATQRYHSSDSANFGHQRCDCTVVPIYGDRDPGRVINKPVLDVLKTRGENYWKSGYVSPDGTAAPRADAD